MLKTQRYRSSTHRPLSVEMVVCSAQQVAIEVGPQQLKNSATTHAFRYLPTDGALWSFLPLSLSLSRPGRRGGLLQRGDCRGRRETQSHGVASAEPNLDTCVKGFRILACAPRLSLASAICEVQPLKDRKSETAPLHIGDGTPPECITVIRAVMYYVFLVRPSKRTPRTSFGRVHSPPRAQHCCVICSTSRTGRAPFVVGKSPAIRHRSAGRCHVFE